MTDIITKPPTIRKAPKLAPIDAPVESSRWKNLHFDVYGNTHLGHLIYETQEAALVIAKEQKAHAEREPDFFFEGMNGRGCFGADYSHAIQIPWKEK